MANFFNGLLGFAMLFGMLWLAYKVIMGLTWGHRQKFNKTSSWKDWNWKRRAVHAFSWMIIVGLFLSFAWVIIPVVLGCVILLALATTHEHQIEDTGCHTCNSRLQCKHCNPSLLTKLTRGY